MDYSIEIIDSNAKFERIKPDFVNIVSEYFLTNSIAFGQYYKDPEYVFRAIFGQTSVFKSNRDLIEFYSKIHQTGIFSENGEKFWFNFFNENNIFLLLYVGNQVVGQVGYHKKDTIVEVIRFYVKPEFRGKGFGTALLHKLLQLAQNNYISEIKLDTYPWQTALSLYLKAGFEYCPYFPEVGFPEEVAKLAETIFMTKKLI